MKIILTNDDGYNAPGIISLQKELIRRGHYVIVVAPQHEKSATSHSLTIHDPLRIKKISTNVYAVNGFPADCVILAAKIIDKMQAELVISGINGGQNMAEDVLYSGTVSGALESSFLGYKAIAISILDYHCQNFETAAHYMGELIEKGIVDTLKKREILNINVPNLPIDKVKGIKLTDLGHREYTDFVTEKIDPRGGTYYWIGGNKPLWDKTPGTDRYEAENGYITITPLKPQFANHDSFARIEKWITNSIGHEDEV